MISITSKSPYAVEALVELGKSGSADQPLPVAELARRRDIPAQFLEQLFATLRRAGILKSQRGVNGGYILIRDPASIFVLEIVEMLDGPVGADASGIFKQAANQAAQILATTTIQDLIEAEEKASVDTMYFI